MADNFKPLFFNNDDFDKAYRFIEQALKSEKRYPNGKDFTDEYAKYFVQLEKAVLK